MKIHLAVFFFITITCFFGCVSMTIFPVPPSPDQVEILLAFKNEFPSRNCDPIWNTPDVVFRSPNISSWTKEAVSFDGVVFDNATGAVTELNLGGACISGTIQANSSLFRFQHLRYLRLFINHFDSSPLPSGFGRLTNLEYLDLSQNGFIGEVPSSISNLSRLTSLDLSYNKLTGRFPHIHNLTLLSSIDLSYNQFSETIPSSLFTMPSLWYLDLRQNHLKDPLENMTSSPSSKLVHLDMAKNLFKYLDLSGNTVSALNTSSKNLSFLILSNCNLTELPTSIKTLQNLRGLDVSKNRLKGKVPEWLWKLPSLGNVNLSQNSLSFLEGSPEVLLNSSLSELDLSSNNFHGSFPITPPTIQVMAASNNYFTGDIPLTLCKASQLILLDLSYNNISGSIHRCLTNVSVLKLRNNGLTGRLPDIDSGLLVLLDVAHNHLSGKLPRSLVNCTSLKFLNVEGNSISDTFPFWLKTLPKLEVIVLRSNRFHGPISSSPERTLSFTALRIMDISLNSFDGTLPSDYFTNLSGPLVNPPQGNRWPEYRGDWHYKYPTEPWYYPSIDVRNKGRNMELAKIPDTCTIIDFSGNGFGGKIPESIGFLKALIVLDLSNNDFTGRVPSSLAKLTQLESLDLSRNQLSGNIPQEIRVLTFLAYINMSYNRLTGQIPQGTQIGGQPKSSFEGNIDLCGLPLEETCFRETTGAPSTQRTQEPELAKQEEVLDWKAAALGYGPGVLFGVAIGQAFATYKPALFYKLFRL
ncbi:hypothetical protein HID58_031251 [Brassica napus]|uniref:Disease resistance R13L4/SHOC-2-like LRR domain-containing protein n=1 Tax=Brassica napus TaxID=3708 RepID=A0ABQ8CI73_BRANA|nr:hypothetical protein HID58_031251 [Brassica napus]